MHELTEDKFYQEIKNYPLCCVAYCLIKSEHPYQGETSHKAAVLFALGQIGKYDKRLWTYDDASMEAVQISAESLLSLPEKPWKINLQGNVYYDDDVIGDRLSYWYAFLEPPYGTQTWDAEGRIIREEYTSDDFHKINQVLFPNGTKELTVYEWNTDWSD